MAKRSPGSKSLTPPKQVDGLNPLGSTTVERENPQVPDVSGVPDKNQEPGSA